MDQNTRDAVLFKILEGVSLITVGLNGSQYTIAHADLWAQWQDLASKYGESVQNLTRLIHPDEDPAP